MSWSHARDDDCQTPHYTTLQTTHWHYSTNHQNQLAPLILATWLGAGITSLSLRTTTRGPFGLARIGRPKEVFGSSTGAS